MNKLSIIIPVYNESETIPSLVKHLLKTASQEHVAEIIFVDGGSTDGTFNSIKQLSGRTESISISSLKSDKGRAKQMNFGAIKACGDILYFLHADSFPPKNFDEHIINAIKKRHEAGCFRMRFDHNHWWLKLMGWLTRLPWLICRGGDQSLFITKSLFHEIGGYDERYVVYEDNDLIKRLYAKNAFVVIPQWLKTSARGYLKHGIWKTQYYYFKIHVKSWCGASPEALLRYYKKTALTT